jgi:hypothetical protein
MDVITVEVLRSDQATKMRSLARRERREESKRHDSMTRRDVMKLIEMDFSMLLTQAAARGRATVKPQLVFASNGLNKYEETAAIAELLFAQPSEGKALLVEFSQSPSRAFEDRFRQAAKNRKVAIHFSRLTGGWVILTVQSKEGPNESDNNLLKDFGVQW